MQIEHSNDAFIIDANLIGTLLNVPPEDVSRLMRERAITSLCEKGIDEHKDEFRLTFFSRTRRVRVRINAAGRILNRSVIDFGDKRLPAVLHDPNR